MIRSLINHLPTPYTITRRAAHLNVSPRIALFDEPCAITAQELTPNSAVTLRADVTNDKGRLFRSHAHYVADEEGCLDITNTPSYGGSYTGVYPMGLFVGLSNVDENFNFVRLFKRNPYIPWNVKISIHEGHTEITDTVEPFTSLAVERHLLIPGVKRVPIKQGKVRGVLYVPPGPGPHPGIIDLYGSVGGLFEHRAQSHASRGIATLSMAYFGYDDLPNNIKKVDLEMFIEAVEVLTSYPGIIPDRCGIWASSQGTIYGYTLADKCEKIKAVVAVNGVPVADRTSIVYKNKVITPPPTQHGSNNMNFKNFVGYTKMEYIKWLVDPNNKHLLNFGPGSLNVSYMIIAGSTDAVGGQIASEAVVKKLRALGNDDVTFLNYEGAGHIIEPPYSSFNNCLYSPFWPNTDGGPILPKGGIYMAIGGSVESHHTAMEDLWPKTINFFNRHIKTESLWYQQWLTDSVPK